MQFLKLFILKFCILSHLEIEGLVSGSGSGDIVQGSGSGDGVVTDEEQEGYVDIDDNPLHGKGHKGGQGPNVGHLPRPSSDKEIRKEDHGGRVEETGQGREDRGRTKGDEKKDDRGRGGRGSGVSLSVTTYVLHIAFFMFFGLQRLLC